VTIANTHWNVIHLGRTIEWKTPASLPGARPSQKEFFRCRCGLAPPVFGPPCLRAAFMPVFRPSRYELLPIGVIGSIGQIGVIASSPRSAFHPRQIHGRNHFGVAQKQRAAAHKSTGPRSASEGATYERLIGR
jgi:hypothetical protein